ncbi:MAG: aspartate ammonia-lyase [Thaumarchaeota archaeon]|nr:aspartate ammonia-lyase [Nitrososphaerota archaeon]
MQFRIDRDSLGEIKINSNAYYGPFTARALKNYNATGTRSHQNIIKAYLMIKKSATLANIRLKKLNSKKGNAIVKACDEILKGSLIDQFIVDTINSGAGTALNMNVNEVIANRALEILHKKKGDYKCINPNDEVNMSQSSNDTFPTALHTAILLDLNEFIPTINKLISSLRKKSREFNNIIKMGRTHLMDALPITLGIEFEAYAIAIEKAKNTIKIASKELEYVALGGTAIGTGANTPKGYRILVVKNLSGISGLNLKPEKNMCYGLQSRFAVANISSVLRNLALELTRLANDIRLMASGPIAGLAEVTIPAIHAGSSIMPGKVNPSLAESLNMVCFNVIGNDLSVAFAVQAGQFELNVMLPVIAKCTLESIDMLKNILPVFSKNMIDGLQANKEQLQSYVEKSPGLVTLFAPYIGYMKASELYKESLKKNISVRELVITKRLMRKEDVDKVLKKKNILKSG